MYFPASLNRPISLKATWFTSANQVRPLLPLPPLPTQEPITDRHPSLSALLAAPADCCFSQHLLLPPPPPRCYLEQVLVVPTPTVVPSCEQQAFTSLNWSLLTEID